MSPIQKLESLLAAGHFDLETAELILAVIEDYENELVEIHNRMKDAVDVLSP